MRLNKYIAQSGYCSRRKADELIEQGKVLVNNLAVQKLGTQVDPENDEVRIKKGPTIQPQRITQLVLFHKPKGYVCTKVSQFHQQTIYDLLPPEFQQLFSIGRLDKDSEGLLLLTNNGDFANQLAHPSAGKEKVYVVSVRGLLTEKDIKQIEKGMRLKEYKTAPAKAEITSYDKEKDQTTLKIILKEGKKRQIRNMFLALKHPVKKLVRMQFGEYELGRLKVGEYRVLNPKSKAQNPMSNPKIQKNEMS